MKGKQVTLVPATRQRLVILPDQRPQDGELPGGRPRFQCLPLAQQPEHLIPGGAGAAPLRAGSGLYGQRQ